MCTRIPVRAHTNWRYSIASVKVQTVRLGSSMVTWRRLDAAANANRYWNTTMTALPVRPNLGKSTAPGKLLAK